MRTFTGIDDMRQAVGTHLGYSQWHVITQERINAFGEATGDLQWIHVDQSRAASGPFGTTIAHGFLSLSLLPLFVADVYQVEGVSMAVNYGTDKVRFPAPVLAGARIRGGFEFTDLRRATMGEQLTIRYTVDLEGSAKPACVAELLTLIVP